MKKDIKTYIDMLVAQERARMCRSMFGVEICNGLEYTVQLRSGIDILANAAGLEVSVNENYSKQFKCISFIYKGVTFMQLENKEGESNEI